MISKIFSPGIRKTLMFLPLFGMSLLLFFSQTTAQQPAKVKKAWRPEFQSTKDGVSAELTTEYEDLVNKYKSPGKQWWKGFDNITDTDKRRLETIYGQMSLDQQNVQIVAFRKPIPPSARALVKQDQLSSWKDGKKYGVWIDNKRVGNEVLNQFTHEDFSHYSVSKLSKNAMNYGKHYYQVNLMTNEHYQQYYTAAIADKENVMLFRGFTFQTSGGSR